MIAASLFISSSGISLAQVNATGDISPTTFSGANWNLGNSSLLIGATGSGNMTIASGGSVSDASGSIATFSGSTGRVEVSGGTWTNAGFFYVGESGNGTLIMTGNGTISAGNGTTIATAAGSTGVANISGGLLSAGPLFYIGENGNGTLNLSGNGVVTATISAVGVFTGTGLAQVSGGNWTTTNELFIGYESNGTVDLSGSALVTAGQVRMGAEASGNGNLTLRGGVLTTGRVEENNGNGTVTFSGGTLRLSGNQTNLFSGFESGDVRLIGPGGGTIDTQAFSVATSLGLTGNGSLTKQGNGTLTLTGNNTYVGPTLVRNGTLIVSGSGSINHAFNSMVVGSLPGDNGTLEITGNGSVSNGFGGIGFNAGATGRVVVSGGTWTNSDLLYIGASGNGTLEISGNGSVSSLGSLIGDEAGSIGRVAVSGGSWTSSSVIGVGSEGNGTLEISGNGSVSSSLVSVASSSSSTSAVDLLGGTLSTGQVSEGPGNGTVTFNGGTLRLTGNQTDLFSGFETGDVQLVGPGGGTINTQSFTVSTALGLTGNGSLTKQGNGTLTLTGNSTYSGGTDLQTGTLLLGDDDAVGTGNVTIRSGTVLGTTSSTSVFLTNNATLDGDFSAQVDQPSILELGGTTNLGTGVRTITLLDEGLLCFAGEVTGGSGLTFLSSSSNGSAAALCGPDDNTFNGTLTVGSGVALQLEKDPGKIAVPGDLVIEQGGFVQLFDNLDQIAASSSVTVNGTLELLNIIGNNTATFAALNGSGNGTVENSNAPAELRVGAGLFAGSISDAGAGSELSLTKFGNGTLTLTGTNIYTGDTTVRGGTLTLNSGGSITHSSANLTVGQAAGESATVSIGANGSLSAFRGFLGFDEGASGLLSIADGNATFADELYIGYTGNGTLEISGNGTLSNTKAFIGVNSPSVSSANITGGVWTNSGELTVGYGGRGSLAISGNGAVTSVGAFFGFLAASNGNNATITGPGASWTSTGTFYLGNDGSDNALEVLGGGSLLTGGADFLIGANSGSGNNSLTISGNGSTFTNNATLYVGRSGIGNAMVIEDGAGVTSRNVRIGGGTGSNGTTSDNFVTVNGTNSTWTIGGTLRVGSNGDNSTLTISNGASVGVSGNSFLGYDASSDGNAVLLSGNGSKWTVSALTIGRLGTNNTVTVSEGGNLTATSMVLAEQGGSSGTLRIGTGGASGSVSVAQISGGNGTALVEFNHSDTNLIFNPILAGSLGVQHIGTGTTTFNATSTYSGGTTISAGTVRTQNTSALGSGLVALDAGTLDPVGTLNISSLTWNGGSVASGLGTATDLVNLSGNLTLGGSGGGFAFTDEAGFAPNTTYTILSAANMNDSLLGLFSGNSLLGLNPVFSRSGFDLLVNFAGSSSGPLLQNVGGPWTPTAADFVVNGPVQTGNATASNTVNSLLFNPDSSLQVFNNLTVTSGRFNVPSGSANLNGGNVITPGDFNKLGDGNLITNSNFQVGGAANIQNGGLFVNGQFSTPGGLTVFQNALLGGSGVIVGNVFNNGIVNPGNSPGTLTINGNFSQSSSGTLQIEIASPSVFDRLVVSGAANLDGTLQILNLGKKLKYGQRYAFLQAGSINGEFDQILMPQPGTFRGRFLAEGGLGSLVVAPTSYTLVAETPNQRRVAKALDSYISARSGDREVVSIALDIQSEEQYPYAFEQIAPGFYESLAEITIGQAFAQTQMINQRLSSVRLGASGFQAIGFDEQPLRHDKDGKSVADAKDFKSEITNLTSPAWAAWAMGTGIFAKAQGISGVPNYRYQAGGFLTGADYAFGERGRTEGPSMTAGIYGGYNYTYAKYSGGSSMQVNSALFGLYGTYAHGGFYADAVIGGGYNGYKANRSIEFSTVDRTARSSPAGGQFNAAINLGYDWKVAGFTFGPIAGLQYTYAGVSSFTEQGADSLDLRVGQQNANSMMMTLGGRVAYTWNISKHIALIPEARIFWQHEFLDNPRLIGAALDGGAGPAFNFQTSTPDRDSVFTGAGITAQFGETWNTFFFYNADFGSSDFVSHSISGGLGVKF